VVEGEIVGHAEAGVSCADTLGLFADDWRFLTRKISQFQVARLRIDARQILADTVKGPLITSPDVSTYLRHG